MGGCGRGWPLPRGGSVFLALCQEFESRDLEVPVERERAGQSFASHHLEADRVDERESLIGEAIQPAEHRVAREVCRNLDPLVDRIVQQVQHRDSCLLHTMQVQQVRMKLPEDQRRANELPARRQVPLRDVDGLGVILISTA